MSLKTDRDVYLEHGPVLMRFAAALVGPDDAADVVSSVVVRALARGPLTELRDAKAYLMQGVANESRNVRRARGRRAVSAARIGVRGDAPAADEGVYPDVTAAVMTLAVRQRAAVYLVYWVGLTPTEAAVELGARPATIRRYLVIARRKLRRFLDE